MSDEAWCAVQRLLYAVEITNQDWGDGGVQVRPEAVEESREVIGLCMDVEERKGANSDQLGPPRLDLLNSGRQAGQGGNDEVFGSLPEGGGREGVTEGGRQGRDSIVGENFLKKDQVRLGLLEDGVEAAEVSPLVGVEGEDGKQRGYGLPVIPRERCSGRCAVKAAKHSYFRAVSWTPSWGRSCRRSGRACGQCGRRQRWQNRRFPCLIPFSSNSQ